MGILRTLPCRQSGGDSGRESVHPRAASDTEGLTVDNRGEVGNKLTFLSGEPSAHASRILPQ